MQTANADLLRDAVSRNCGVVLSLPSAGLIRHHKSRFLSEEQDGLWIESVPSEEALVRELITNATPVGISFRTEGTKAMFTVPVQRCEPAYRINAGVTVGALLVARPMTFTAVQRRSDYRVRVMSHSELSARVWRVSERATLRERPMAAQEIATELIDVSLGGIGVCLRGRDKAPPKVTPEDRLRVELTFRDEVLLLEGRCRTVRPIEGAADSCRTGIEFKKLEKDLEGRQTLSRLTFIVGQLQRDEIRRARLGVA